MQQGFKIGLLTLVVLGLLAPAISAQTFGRLDIKIVNADGTPVPGVEVVVTQDDLPKFLQEKRTNKRGTAIVSLVDATKIYLFTFNHPDYPEVRQYLKAQLGTTTKIEIVIDTQEALPVDGGDEPKVSFTPAQTAYNEGVEAIRGGDRVLAEEKLLEALRLDSSLNPSHSLLARVYVDSERWEMAIASAETFFDNDGSDPGLYRVLYEAHSALGNTSEAKKAIDQLSGSGSKEDAAAMLYNEGVAAFRIGDDEEAVTRFGEALQILPELAPALKALAVVQNRKGDPANAAATADRYLALEPQDAAILQLRWRAYRTLGDEAKLAEAQAALGAVDASPLAQELFLRGTELFQTGDSQAAAEEFRAALDWMPDHPGAHYQLGLSYLSQEANSEARMHLERFLELAPDHPEAASAEEMLTYLE